MKFAILAALAGIIGVVNATHADCTGIGCSTPEPMATNPPQPNFPCNGSSCATLRSTSRFGPRTDGIIPYGQQIRRWPAK
jgi:hypothetical protein